MSDTKFELFVDQPSVYLKKGIMVHKDTEVAFKNESVEQLIRDLKLDIIMDEEGTSGLNSYKSKSHITITLNEGDILLFDPSRGYYLPPCPVTTIEKAVEDLSAMQSVKLRYE